MEQVTHLGVGNLLDKLADVGMYLLLLVLLLLLLLGVLLLALVSLGLVLLLLLGGHLDVPPCYLVQLGVVFPLPGRPNVSLVHLVLVGSVLLLPGCLDVPPSHLVQLRSGLPLHRALEGGV